MEREGEKGTDEVGEGGAGKVALWLLRGWASLGLAEVCALRAHSPVEGWTLEPCTGQAGVYNFEKSSGRAQKLLGQAGPGWSAYGP